MAVSFCELPGSPKATYNGKTFGFTRTVRVAWADAYAFALELAPLTVVLGNQIVQVGGVSFPGFAAARVATFNWEPMHSGNDRITGGGTSMTVASNPAEYQWAKFTINYAVPEAAQDGDDVAVDDPVAFLRHRITSGGQLLTVPSFEDDDYKWVWQTDDGIPVDVPEGTPIPVMVSTSSHSVTWPRVIQPNWRALEGLKGHVNDSAITLRGYPHDPETILYLNYDAQRDVLTDGTRAWEITIHFETKEVTANFAQWNKVTGAWEDATVVGGHNHFWREDSGSWRRVVTKASYDSVSPANASVYDTDLVSPYPRADLTELFLAGS